MPRTFLCEEKIAGRSESDISVLFTLTFYFATDLKLCSYNY